MNNDLNKILQLRSIQIELLDKFKSICDENNLVYFLAGGTLLGAVRHKGYIPWDDDIDVAMPRDDFEKFLLISENLKNDKYYVLSHKSDNIPGKHCKHFAKLCKTGTVFAESYRRSGGYPGIFIDIFPYDNCVIFFTPLHTFLIKLLLKLCRIKAKVDITNKKYIYFLGNFFCMLFTEKFLNKFHRSLYFIFNKNKTKYISFFSGINGWKRETHILNDILPLSKVIFEDKYYNAPGNYDKFLRILYGNYMELPPVEKRHTHSHEYIKFNDD